MCNTNWLYVAELSTQQEMCLPYWVQLATDCVFWRSRIAHPDLIEEVALARVALRLLTLIAMGSKQYAMAKPAMKLLFERAAAPPEVLSRITVSALQLPRRRLISAICIQPVSARAWQRCAETGQ